MTGLVDEQKVAHRPRESTYPMVSVEQAQDTVLKHATHLGTHKRYFQGKSNLSHSQNSMPHLLVLSNPYAFILPVNANCRCLRICAGRRCVC